MNEERFGPMIVRMSVENIGEQITTAFCQRADDYKEMVGKAVQNIIASGRIERLVEEEVNAALERSIKSAISSYEVEMELTNRVKNQMIQDIQTVKE